MPYTQRGYRTSKCRLNEVRLIEEVSSHVLFHKISLNNFLTQVFKALRLALSFIISNGSKEKILQSQVSAIMANIVIKS